MRARTARLIVALASILLVALVAAPPALGFLPAQFGGTVTIPLTDRPLTLDPTRATRAAEMQLVALLYDTLYRVGDDGGARPHLAAEMPQPLSTGKCCLVPLRKGVVLHDGSTLTASDVVSLLDRLRWTEHRYLLPRVSAIVARGEDAVEVVLDTLDPKRLALSLGQPVTAIAVKRGGKLTGSGPFRLRQREREGISLAVHDKHFAGRPYLDRVRFRLFERSSTEVATYQVGASQLSYHGVSVFGGSPRHRPASLAASPWTTVVLRVGQQGAGGGHSALQQLLSLAIDRTRLAKLVGSQSMAASALAPVDAASRAPAAHDRRRARQLLQALRRQHPTLATKRLSLLVDASRLDDRVLAGQLVADLDRIGLSVEVKVVRAAQFAEQVARGAAHLALDRFVAPVPLARYALARALARASRHKLAVECLTGTCAPDGWKRAALGLGLVPLVHLRIRAHYDARLGGLRLLPSGAIELADVYWRRDR